MSCASSAPNTISKTADLGMHQFESLDSLMALQQKPVVVFLHAPWCQFCKNMEQTTLTDNKVIELLNKEYYFVSFNGEQTEVVKFRNYDFQYQPTGRNSGTHELAKKLGTIDRTLTYPSLVILDPQYEIVFQYNAFLDSKQILSILMEGVKER